MSHISSVKITLTDREALFKALKRLGLEAEVYEGAMPVLYRGRIQAGKVANVIVRNPYGYHADLGFEYREDGIRTYTDTYYQTGQDLVKKLTQAYGVERARKEARRKGFSVREQELENGSVRLVLRRY